MRALTTTEITTVSGGLGLNLGNLLVGQNINLQAITSGTGTVGSLLGALGLGLQIPNLLSLAPTSATA